MFLCEDFGPEFNNSKKYYKHIEIKHSKLRMAEETHGFKVKRNLATPIHLDKALRSIVFDNSKHSEGIPAKKWDWGNIPAIALVQTPAPPDLSLEMVIISVKYIWIPTHNKQY